MTYLYVVAATTTTITFIISRLSWSLQVPLHDRPSGMRPVREEPPSLLLLLLLRLLLLLQHLLPYKNTAASTTLWPFRSRFAAVSL